MPKDDATGDAVRRWVVAEVEKATAGVNILDLLSLAARKGYDVRVTRKAVEHLVEFGPLALDRGMRLTLAPGPQKAVSGS